MAISKEVEEIVSSIDMLKGNAYDKLMQTIHEIWRICLKKKYLQYLVNLLVI